MDGVSPYGSSRFLSSVESSMSSGISSAEYNSPLFLFGGSNLWKKLIIQLEVKTEAEDVEAIAERIQDVIDEALSEDKILNCLLVSWRSELKEIKEVERCRDCKWFEEECCTYYGDLVIFEISPDHPACDHFEPR